MTLEASAPSAKQSAHAASDARGRKPHAQGSTDAPPATGFMAVLSAVEDVEEVGEAPAVASSQNFEPNWLVAPVDTAQAAIETIAKNALTTTLQPLAGTLEAAGAAVPTTAVPDMGGGAQAVRGAKALPVPGAGLLAAEADAKPKGNPLADAADAFGQSTEALQKSGLAHASSRAQGASLAHAMPDAQTAGNAQAAHKTHDAQFFASLDAMKAAQGGAEVVGTSALAAAAPATAERSTGERGHTRERDAEGMFATQFAPLGVTSYASAAVQEAGAVPAEMQVAQQVTYWISQDIQNAELKLDGLGKEAVEVSISMHGNEAHVTFRTDELQARTLLEGAAAHLKDLLQSEGLVLSGVSVGTSGAGNAGGEERKQRQGHRQSGMVPVTVVATDARRMPTMGATGRTLDLFV